MEQHFQASQNPMTTNKFCRGFPGNSGKDSMEMKGRKTGALGNFIQSKILLGFFLNFINHPVNLFVLIHDLF